MRHCLRIVPNFASFSLIVDSSAATSVFQCFAVFRSSLVRPETECRRRQEGVAVHCPFAQAAEVAEQLIELALRDRVELVIVADAAAERQAEEHGPRRRDAIDRVAAVKLLVDRAPFARRDVAAAEARRHALIDRWVGKQVAGQLLDGETIERQVRVERRESASRGTARSSARCRDACRACRRNGPRRASSGSSARRIAANRAGDRRAFRTRWETGRPGTRSTSPRRRRQPGEVETSPGESKWSCRPAEKGPGLPHPVGRGRNGRSDCGPAPDVAPAARQHAGEAATTSDRGTRPLRRSTA